jgi:hypothetical protein
MSARDVDGRFADVQVKLALREERPFPQPEAGDRAAEGQPLHELTTIEMHLARRYHCVQKERAGTDSGPLIAKVMKVLLNYGQVAAIILMAVSFM